MKKIGLQFTRYLIIGVANTIVDASTYFALTRLTPLESYLTVSKAISYIVALTFSYWVNSKWTFNSAPSFSKLLCFYSTVGTGIFINVGTHYYFSTVLHVNDLVAVFIAAAGTALWGFALARFVVFKT